MVTLQELEQKKIELESSIQYCLRTGASLTEAALRKELFIIELAIAGLKLSK